MADTKLPSGTVTLLFTDIEGSTRLIKELGEDGYVQALAEHRLKAFDRALDRYELGRGRFQPLKTISNKNLPSPDPSFVGRQQERDEVVSLLSNGTRLRTLRDPGGSGKTRLAIEAATELVP